MPRAEEYLEPTLSADTLEPLAPRPDNDHAVSRQSRWMPWAHRLCCAAALQSLVSLVWYVLDQLCACKFEHNAAANGTTVSQTFAKDMTECCDFCAVDTDCSAATFYGAISGTAFGLRANCTADTPVPCNCVLTNSRTDLVHTESSWGCVPPHYTTEEYARLWIDNLVAEAPVWLRGAIVTAALSCLCRKASGFGARNGNPVVLAALGWSRSYQPLGWDELVGRESIRELIPCNRFVAESQLNIPSWEEARNANRLTAHQALSVGGIKLFLWHLSQPVAFSVALWVSACHIGQHQREIASYVAAREILYIAIVLMTTYHYPAFLLLNLRSTWAAATHWTRRLAQLCTYVFAPHHYVTLCLWRCGAMSNAIAQIVLLFQLVSDCFGLCALGIFLGRAAALPPTAILVGYTITAVGFGFAAFIAAISCAAYALDTSFGKRKRLWFGFCAVLALSLLFVVCWFYLVLPLWRRILQ